MQCIGRLALPKRDRILSARQVPLLSHCQRLLPRYSCFHLGSGKGPGRSAYEVHQQACTLATGREKFLPVLCLAFRRRYHASAAGTARCHPSEVVLQDLPDSDAER
jgi:hypothetical protein